MLEEIDSLTGSVFGKPHVDVKKLKERDTSQVLFQLLCREFVACGAWGWQDSLSLLVQKHFSSRSVELPQVLAVMKNPYWSLACSFTRASETPSWRAGRLQLLKACVTSIIAL